MIEQQDRISRYLGLHLCFVRKLHDNKLSSSLVQGPKGRSKHIYAVDQSISIKVRKPAAPKKRKAGEGEAVQNLPPNPIQPSSHTGVVQSGRNCVLTERRIRRQRLPFLRPQ